MFGRLFGKQAVSSEHKEDRVWRTTAACRRGICAEAVQSAAAGRSVLVVCLSHATFDAVDSVLAPQQPVHCRDLFGRDALRAALVRQGADTGAIVIVLSGSLPADAPTNSGEVDFLVYGRNATRAADDLIQHFADQMGARATIAFHVSLEDALLKPLVASSLPLLEQLGMKDDEPLSHTLVTRAIKNIQAP
jgi:preprotein translocase subunit SecA